MCSDNAVQSGVLAIRHSLCESLRSALLVATKSVVVPGSSETVSMLTVSLCGANLRRFSLRIGVDNIHPQPRPQRAGDRPNAAPCSSCYCPDPSLSSAAYRWLAGWRMVQWSQPCHNHRRDLSCMPIQTTNRQDSAAPDRSKIPRASPRSLSKQTTFYRPRGHVSRGGGRCRSVTR